MAPRPRILVDRFRIGPTILTDRVCYGPNYPRYHLVMPLEPEVTNIKHAVNRHRVSFSVNDVIFVPVSVHKTILMSCHET